MSIFSNYHNEIIKLIYFVAVCRKGIEMGARATQMDSLMKRIEERLGKKTTTLMNNNEVSSIMDIMDIRVIMGLGS